MSMKDCKAKEGKGDDFTFLTALLDEGSCQDDVLVAGSGTRSKQQEEGQYEVERGNQVSSSAHLGTV